MLVSSLMAAYVDSSSKLSVKILYNCFDSNLMMALALHTSESECM